MDQSAAERKQRRLFDIVDEMLSMSVNAKLGKPCDVFRWRDLEGELLERLPEVLHAVAFAEGYRQSMRSN